MTAFPRLRQLMSAYLNQDFDVHGDTVEAVILEFARTGSAEDGRAAVKELDTLLASPSDGLLKRFEDEVSRDDLIIGENDAEARAWLERARSLIDGAVQRGHVSEAPPQRPPLVRWLSQVGAFIAPPRGR